MRPRIALVYNQPEASRYSNRGEEAAVVGVMDAVHAVERALRELGHELVLLPLTPPVEEIKPKLAGLEVKLIFNLFEGLCGEPETEALIPEACEQLDIAYTGCPAPVLRLGLDKARAKALLKSSGVRTPDYQVLDPATVSAFRMRFPCIVKPRAEDASHGVSEASVVHDMVGMARQVEVISQAYGGNALVEEYVDGREFNATGMGNRDCLVLPASEIVFSLPEGLPRILSFDAKWQEDSPYFVGTRAVCPADITGVERKQIVQTVTKVYRLFGCRGYARVDMRMDRAGKINVIEINPNPDISPGTGAARQADALGWTYAQFIDRIVQLAMERHGGFSDPAPDDGRGQSGDYACSAEHP